jgi:Domain of unknown function (DUF4395)
MNSLFSFPNPVNEAAARTVAAGVVLIGVVALASSTPWLLLVLLYGFTARVLTGPTLSPLGTFAVRVAAPWIERSRWSRVAVFSPGPPKRFAQGVGFVFSLSATVVWLSVGWGAARWILIALLVAASLEAFVGYCLGCAGFRILMRWGIIPESVCEACNDISRRRPPVA